MSAIEIDEASYQHLSNCIDYNKYQNTANEDDVLMMLLLKDLSELVEDMKAGIVSFFCYERNDTRTIWVVQGPRKFPLVTLLYENENENGTVTSFAKKNSDGMPTSEKYADGKLTGDQEHHVHDGSLMSTDAQSLSSPAELEESMVRDFALQNVIPIINEEAVDASSEYQIGPGDASVHEQCDDDPNAKEISQPITEHSEQPTVNPQPLKKEKRHQCSYCKKKFRTPSYVKVHERRHTDERPYECSQCEKKFLTMNKLKTHNQNHKGENNARRCSDHEKKFIALERLKMYEQSRKEAMSYQRSHSENSFVVASESAKVAGDKPYQCSFCGKKFVRPDLVKIHELRYHTGEGPHQCSQCEKKFFTSTDLKIHERFHTGEKPYQCSYCGKRFLTVQKVEQHERFHTGERPYQCSHCEKRFITATQLQIHEQYHKGEKTYPCFHCNKTFITSRELKAHGRHHAGETL